ncbi:efflux RND transporter periplasmic adaptor subunit [Actinoplanes xinjiangensis]|uniref:efflux RND transporter periplasmic adaptor subunit n=1 Tax=Actinoplanes xinjiangensis TaxID=512350 RepID=UPI00341ADF6D
MGVALAGRRRLIWLAVAVVVLALTAFGVVRALTAGAAREEPTAAEIVRADKGAVTTAVATTGTLQAAQTRSLSFAVSAEVETVEVRAGNTVTAGQVLATVDDTAAAEKVDDASSALSDAYDSLESARSAATSTTSSGCDVAAAYTTSVSASVSASVSPSPSPSATKTARPPASTSPTGSPSATKTVRPRTSATKTCPTPVDGGGGTRGGSSGGDAILSAQQRVNAAEVALEEAEESLAGTTIRAPIAGKIISVGGRVGSTAKSGSAFITLADVYDMQISADFPEADADHLEVTQKAVITLADRPGETFGATVVQVDPVGTSDGTLTRFGVVLSFDDAPDELLVGQSANVRVTTGSKEEVLRVPSTAVHDVSGDSGTVLRNGAEVEVELGLRGDQYTEIVAGITEGDPVVRSW